MCRKTCFDHEEDEEEEAAAATPLDLTYQFKVVLLGAPSVGKTTFASVAAGYPGQTRAAYQPTVGVDFYSVALALPLDGGAAGGTAGGDGAAGDGSGAVGASGDDNGAATAAVAAATVQLWDVGGGCSAAMAATYVGGADAVLLVHDLAAPATLAAAEGWLNTLRPMFGGGSGPYLALLANDTGAAAPVAAAAAPAAAAAAAPTAAPPAAAAATSWGRVSLPGEAVDGGAGQQQQQQQDAPFDGCDFAVEDNISGGGGGGSSRAEALARHRRLAADLDAYSFCAAAARRGQGTAVLAQIAADLAGLPRPRGCFEGGAGGGGGSGCGGDDDDAGEPSNAAAGAAAVVVWQQPSAPASRILARLSSALRSLAARCCCCSGCLCVPSSSAQM